MLSLSVYVHFSSTTIVNIILLALQECLFLLLSGFFHNAFHTGIHLINKTVWGSRARVMCFGSLQTSTFLCQSGTLVGAA